MGERQIYAQHDTHQTCITYALLLYKYIDGLVQERRNSRALAIGSFFHKAIAI